CTRFPSPRTSPRPASWRRRATAARGRCGRARSRTARCSTNGCTPSCETSSPGGRRRGRSCRIAAIRRNQGRRSRRRDGSLNVAAQEALLRLQEGNRRFLAGAGREGGLESLARRAELVAGQQPFAIILGCSDSRVPAEIVFDQGLGDLFVIRVAGNVVAPSQIGSVEF